MFDFETAWEKDLKDLTQEEYEDLYCEDESCDPEPPEEDEDYNAPYLLKKESKKGNTMKKRYREEMMDPNAQQPDASGYDFQQLAEPNPTAPDMSGAPVPPPAQVDPNMGVAPQAPMATTAPTNPLVPPAPGMIPTGWTYPQQTPMAAAMQTGDANMAMEGVTPPAESPDLSPEEDQLVQEFRQWKRKAIREELGDEELPPEVPENVNLNEPGSDPLDIEDEDNTEDEDEDVDVDESFIDELRDIAVDINELFVDAGGDIDDVVGGNDFEDSDDLGPQAEAEPEEPFEDNVELNPEEQELYESFLRENKLADRLDHDDPDEYEKKAYGKKGKEKEEKDKKDTKPSRKKESGLTRNGGVNVSIPGNPNPEVSEDARNLVSSIIYPAASKPSIVEKKAKVLNARMQERKAAIRKLREEVEADLRDADKTVNEVIDEVVDGSNHGYKSLNGNLDDRVMGESAILKNRYSNKFLENYTKKQELNWQKLLDDGLLG
jgi:hypothetical protein